MQPLFLHRISVVRVYVYIATTTDPAGRDLRQLTKRSRKKQKKYREINENEHTTTQNIWVTAKAVQGEKFISL